MAVLFESSEMTSSQRYRDFRDHPYLESHRNLLEEMWCLFEPYSDSNFIREFRLQFDKRVWEMHLVVTLLECDHRISSFKSGPDILVTTKPPNVWVEAVMPGSGAGPDSPTDVADRGEGGWVNDDRIILRFRSAIEEKYGKYLRYLDTGIIEEKDPYVIAINGSDVPLSIFEGSLPRILSCVLALGIVNYVYPSGEPNNGYPEIGYRESIEKASGSPVATDIFMGSEYSGISAVLFSNTSAENIARPLGKDFVLVRNHNAANRISQGFLSIGSEWWMDSNELRRELY